MKRITAYCRLKEDYCAVNGAEVARRDLASSDSWFKQIYKEQGFVYPKFYKMDSLSQAGYLASELIKRANPDFATNYEDDEIALVFANSVSSTDTDLRFIKSYEGSDSPSPSVFVYTLPNIVLGEIAILNKWYGENMFAVLPKFAPGFFLNYLQVIGSTGAKAALCGWLEVLEGSIDVLLFLVEESGTDSLELNAENLLNLSLT
ncbi:hypothetical protein [Dyadobacter sp. Leaf189]|uniref:hypothetical protein n=1 Tax=Dyadobacter sp. Leaf189 TaxID=1736295 RepID=UPI0006FE5C1D|nr:hypothetical protein [Dyadobacter sp. Leaf189]KQS27732.1 hypothetical protein ASG33_14980 [Dyadobacter sp. Leaf189]